MSKLDASNKQQKSELEHVVGESTKVDVEFSTVKYIQSNRRLKLFSRHHQ